MPNKKLVFSPPHVGVDTVNRWLNGDGSAETLGSYNTEPRPPGSRVSVPLGQVLW